LLGAVGAHLVILLSAAALIEVCGILSILLLLLMMSPISNMTEGLKQRARGLVLM
jgi:hypothetical protein